MAKPTSLLSRPKGMDQEVVSMEDRKRMDISSSNNNRLDTTTTTTTQIPGDDEVLQEILKKIRDRRGRMLQIAKHRYESTTSISTNDGSSSPGIMSSSPTTTTNRRQRLNAASKLKTNLIQQQQQQSIRRSVGDFLSHLQLYEKKTMEQEVTFEGHDTISSPVQQDITNSRNVKVHTSSNPQQQQQRDIQLVRQTFLGKPRVSYSSSSLSRIPSLPLTVMVPKNMTSPKRMPETFRLEIQQCESFPRVHKVLGPKIYDALMDKDDDSQSQDSDDTHVPDNLKHLFNSTCGTNSSLIPDLTPSDSPISTTTSFFSFPGIFLVSDQVLEKSNPSDQHKKRESLSHTSSWKQHEYEETTDMALSKVNTQAAADHDDAAAAAAIASESCLFSSPFLSSHGDCVCASKETTSLPMATIPNSFHLDENPKTKEIHVISTQPIGIETQSDIPSDVPNRNIPMDTPQEIPNLQDIEGNIATIPKDVIEKDNLKPTVDIESTPTNLFEPSELAEIKLDSLQDPEGPSIEVFRSSGKILQDNNAPMEKDQQTVTTIPTSIQFVKDPSTTDVKSRKLSRSLTLKQESILKKVNGIVPQGNSRSMSRSILHSERFRKFRSHFLKRRQHYPSMEEKQDDWMVETLSSGKRMDVDKANFQDSSSIKNKELTFHNEDPFSLEVSFRQDNHVDCAVSLDSKKETDIPTDLVMDETYFHFNFQDEKQDSEEKVDPVCPSDEDESYVADTSKTRGKDSNPDHSHISNSWDLRLFPEFLYNTLFHDNTQNSHIHPKSIPPNSDIIAGFDNDSFTLDEEIPSLEEEEEDDDGRPSLEDEGWSKEDYDDDNDDENDPSFKDAFISRIDDNDNDARSVALSEGVDRVLNAATESGLFETYADIDDMWLAKVVLKKFAKAQNLAVDDLIETVCDKLDALDASLFHRGDQHVDVVNGKCHPPDSQNVEESTPYWSPHDFIRGSTQFSV